MNHLDAAQACKALYEVEAPTTIGGVSFATSGNTIVLRGSQSAEDWIRDFAAVPRWTELGFVHLGFWEGMEELFSSLAFERPVIVGHSLGGAHAALLAGLFVVRGKGVEELITFASPRPAFPNLRRVLEKAGVKRTNYRFHNDPVPLAPFPLLALPWEHVEDWTALTAPTGDSLDPLRDHSIENYINALSGGA